MFNYVAACWNVEAESQRHVAGLIDARMRADSEAWTVVFRRPGLVVYCTGLRPGSSEVYSLQDNSGVVLGTVFTRIGDAIAAPTKAIFRSRESGDVLRSYGRSLADHYWGRYVAFLTPPDHSSTMVMRSPNTELDCLSTQIQGVRLYFSSTEHCPALSLRRLSVNWDYLAADLSVLLPDTRATGLAEIERLMRGECIRHSRDRSEILAHWHPFRFVRAEPIEDAATAMTELYRVARGSVGAWASCYDRIIAMLSGGLDSSIIVGLLRQLEPTPNVVCMNYRNAYDPTSDERSYARLVSARSEYPLIEHEQSLDFSLDQILQMPRTISPCLSIYGLGELGRRAQVARSHRADAWFVGHGGDEVFFKNAGRYSCADFVHRYGLRPGVFSVALGAARMRNRALWPTLRDGIRDGLRRNGLDTVRKSYAEFFPLLRQDALEDVRRKQLFIPHWFDEADGLPPGKCSQIISLSVAVPMYSCYAPDDEPEAINPLMSQPMQELSLRIPTHILALGGKSRGLARRAFAAHLPPAIVHRRTKGGVRDFLKEFWLTNQVAIRDHLLDGTLVQRGIVDRARLEKTLDGSFEGDFSRAPQMVSLVCAEAWVRNWQRTESKVAA